VQIPATEAISLLRKWQQEITLLQCALYDNPPDDEKAICVIMGYVEHIDEQRLYIDGSHIENLGNYGKYFSCNVTLADALYQFGDIRDAADERSAESFKTTHDCFLAILLPTGGLCEILATKPKVRSLRSCLESRGNRFSVKKQRML